MIDTGTAWLFEPGPHGEGTEPFWPDPGRYAEVVARFARAGFQCATHAIGDRAVAAALDAYRDAGGGGGAPHRIEHIETLRDAELARFKYPGVDVQVLTPGVPLQLRPLEFDQVGMAAALDRGRADALGCLERWRAGRP